MAQFAKSTFSHASYAAFRPTYPPKLYSTVLAYAHNNHQSDTPNNVNPSKHHAEASGTCVDLGTGHALIARHLSPHFSRVIAVDPSQGMLSQARSLTTQDKYPNISFRQSAAEHLPFIEDGSVDLIVAGQAAHWFDDGKLWPELARISRSRTASLAFWGYKDPVFPGHPVASAILQRYTYGESRDLLGPYWGQPGRSRVQNLLRDIKPPGDEWRDVQRIEFEPDATGMSEDTGLVLERKRITLGECMHYVRTFSSFAAWREAHPGEEHRARDEGGAGDVVDEMFDEMRAAEGEWAGDGGGEGEGWRDVEVEMEWGSALVMARRR